jgi:hypothetical protein
MTEGEAETDTPSATPSTGETRTAHGIAGRLPVLMFATVEGIAFVYYLALAHTQWFFADEWEFLAGRGFNIHDLLRAHYGHWVAIPIVIYRVLWELVGLRSYLPYVMVTIVMHLIAAALLRIVMLRAGVRPWIAALAASVFALFGAGAQDLLWAFQVTFTGALVFGLAQLLLADHDGPVDRRDWFGLAAGLAALMCSGVAVTMVIVVGVQTWLRRGWRVAALHTVPLGAVYGAWWLRYSHGKYTLGGTPRQMFDWFVSGAAGLFGALGQVPGFGWVLGVVLIGGLVLGVREHRRSAFPDRFAMPAALLVGVVAFLVLAGYDRGAIGSSFARSSRYLHILGALLIPVLAVAIDALVRRSKTVGTIALGVLLIGVPGNVANVRHRAHRDAPRAATTRQLMLSLPRLPLARHVPQDLRPEPNLSSQVTVGWLRRALAEGRLPSSRPPGPAKLLSFELRLSLMELDEKSKYPCRALSTPTVLRLEPGDKIGLGTGTVGVSLVSGGARSSPVSFGRALLNPGIEHTLVAVKGPLTFRIKPAPTGAQLCTAGTR